jgi:hypothetical protein
MPELLLLPQPQQGRIIKCNLVLYSSKSKKLGTVFPESILDCEIVSPIYIPHLNPNESLMNGCDGYSLILWFVYEWVRWSIISKSIFVPCWVRLELLSFNIVFVLWLRIFDYLEKRSPGSKGLVTWVCIILHHSKG